MLADEQKDSLRELAAVLRANVPATLYGHDIEDALYAIDQLVARGVTVTL